MERCEVEMMVVGGEEEEDESDEEMKKEYTVKLLSIKGFHFIVDKKAPWSSQTIRNMLTSLGQCRRIREDATRRGAFPEIITLILKKICQYFYWSLQYVRCSNKFLDKEKGEQSGSWAHEQICKYTRSPVPMKR
uniref:Elongin-C n=1 Tax=Ananas comosus var. bracteatus TaxID=296719 RepID=A0A6V7NI33_ANACO|nr:unnamed protein product [Ananas comosus var. bracteatus]